MDPSTSRSSRPTTRFAANPSSSARSPTPPSPRSTGVPLSSAGHAPIAITKDHYFGENAHAGPSSEGALRRDSAATEIALVPSAPSSAPPTPSAIGMTHPPQFIHTHHPRRGSITPLGLNVISPVGPFAGQSVGSPISPTRTTGFSPMPVDPNGSPSQSSLRRGSTTSTASTLTQSRPSNLNLNAAVNRERRRSSLTPANPTLAPPSPSRALASGRMNTRPSSSDGQDGRPNRQRTVDGAPRPLGSLYGAGLDAAAAIEARRGSLPHLGGGHHWTGPVKWSPSLPAQRGSLTDTNIGSPGGTTALPNEDFKFGNGAPSPSAAAAALRAFDLNSASRRSSMSRKPLDVFEEAEAIEAERQRKAFLAATYGVEAKRARERLSFSAAPGSALAPGNSPPNGSRRPSLMLWERLGGFAGVRAQDVEGQQPAMSSSTPVLPSTATVDSDLGQRRGSLPIAIPHLGRSLSQRGGLTDPLITQSVEEGSSPTESERKDSKDISNSLYVRPLPPLMPLSDPGPREFPSNLALQRASHLLNSRNLQAEPLPHPLPPSLHPPAPIDISEFDIDFILAGSRSQLGGKGGMNAPVDVVPKVKGEVPPTPTLKLGAGGEDEDTFAKFVGAFDEEYGDRRGMWSFRACPPSQTPPGDDLRDPLDNSGGPSRIQLKAEWESRGAGKFGLYHNGEVRSVQTGAVWRVRRCAMREYEINEVSRGKSIRSDSVSQGANKSNRPSVVITTGESYILTSKARHREFGGIKLAQHGNASSTGTIRPSPSGRHHSASGPPSTAAKLRASISEATGGRIGRGSEDSASTAVPLSQSLPLGPGLAAFLPRKKSSRDASAELEAAGHGSPSVSFPPQTLATHIESSGREEKAEKHHHHKHMSRSMSKDRSKESADAEDKKKAGKVLGGVLKRAFMHGHDEKKAAKEEKMRERAQAHSWGGSASASHKAASYFAPSPASAQAPQRPAMSNALRGHEDGAGGASTNLSATPSVASETSDKRGDSTDERDRQPSLSSVAEDEGHLLREGKGWNVVPDEAVAMVLPLPADEDLRPAPSSLQSSISIWDARQALLVWWVPFEPKKEDEEDRPTTSNSAASSQAPSDGSSPSSSSMPKLQKLLRRRTSKDKDALKKAAPETPNKLLPRDPGDVTNPLPFRSFRIVARVIETDELRNDRDAVAGLGFEQWTEQRNSSSYRPTGSGDSKESHGQSTSSSATSPYHPQSILPHDDADASSYSTAPTSTIMAGRTFPTVIAVCHSRNQGVEFVLEGLDRLGLCQGESAWGPTGYEEWRGSGLSPKGREMVDIIWVGCTAVMGILAA